jgi:hypothetical protein
MQIYLPDWSPDPRLRSTVAILHLNLQILLALYTHNGHLLAIEISS